MKRLRKDKIKKILAFMVALALMVSCMPSAYTISASETFGDGTEDLFTDGGTESEPAAEESTPDVSGADQGEQAQQITTLTYENDSVKVTAEAQEEGALPQNTSLRADTVNEYSSVAYDLVSQKLSKAAEDKGSSLRGFFAFDVYLADESGNRVEPNGRIRVTVEYKVPAAPELADAAGTNVTVEKLYYDSSTGETVCYVLQPNEELKVLNVNEARQLQTVQVETSNDAVFAVMWDSPEAAVSEENESAGEAEENDENVEVTDEVIAPEVDPEITEAPMEEPEVTETPVEEPEVTEAPVEEPEVTEAPAEEPEVTEAPVEEPEVTEAPVEEPEVTEVPVEEPEVTEVPVEEPEVTEAPVENPEAMIIEVVEEEVNLRAEPSTDAEVVATVPGGTQFTVQETVTAEDATTWYKVSYEEMDAYIRSDVVKVVESDEDSELAEDEVTELSNTVTYTETMDNVIVTATADQGVLPEDAQFVVTPIEKESAQYAEVAAKLEQKAENENYSIAGFFAYDIYFLDSEGNKIHPEDGNVKVFMEYQNAAAPEEVKEAGVETLSLMSEDENSQNDTEQQNYSISVMHFEEDEEGNVQSVVDMTQEGKANVESDAEGSVQKAEFETESFSTFTITWKKNNSFGTNLIIKYVDENGTEIDTESVQEDLILVENEEKDLNDYQHPVSGYKYESTKLDSPEGKDIRYVRLKELAENENWTEERTPQVSADGENWTDVQKSSVIYMVYSRISDSPISDGDLEVAHEKYIDKNNDGTYDLTLNVAGTVETQTTQAKVDVLLITDVSASMTNNNSTKLDDTKAAVKALIETFSKKENVDVRYQLVKFSNGATNVTTQWQTGDNFYNNYVANLSANGGTNYEQGLIKAQTPLNDSRSDATRIVIFLTDGEPTFYGKVAEGKTYPHGRGSSVSDGTLTAALNAAAQLDKLDKFYAVGIGLGDLKGKTIYKYDNAETSEGYGGNVARDYWNGYYYTSDEKTENTTYKNYKTGLDILNAVTAKIRVSEANKEAINLKDSSQLTDKFKEIAGSSLTFACSGVKIEDTLSKYVQPTDQSALNIRVLKKDANGNFEKTPIADVTGSAKLADTTANVEGVSITAHYEHNEEQNLDKVTLSFPDGYELKENYYYYVTITNLEPTKAAYDEYRSFGYNAAGDRLTDASEDKNSGVSEGSSSEQPGFYSNSEAKVSYTYKNKGNSVDYAKPVIQVIDSDLVKSKTAKVVSWDDRTYNITLNASSTVKTTSRPKPVEVILVFDRSGSMHFRSKLDPYKNCTKNELEAGKVYYYMDTDDKATVYRVWSEEAGGNTTWYYIDDSYWDYSSNKIVSGRKKAALDNQERLYYTDGDPGHDRFYYLKQAATEFTTRLADKSAGTKAALIAFCSTATTEMELTALTPENVNILNSKINSMQTSGGTYQNVALDRATGILEKDTSDLQRYVILLTDGCPNGVDYDTVEKSVDRLKAQRNTTLMTIGVGLKDNAGLENAKTKLSEWASEASNGKKYAYNADDGDQLFGVFDSILSSITQKAPVEDAYIKDYIDNNFELTKKERERLQKDPDVEIGEDSNGTYILWKKQTIPAQGSNGKAGWSKTFQVKAKDSFIGGNNIKTNGAGSGITVKDRFMEFEQPTVNVKVKIFINDKEITIYKGDTIPTDEAILNQLFNESDVTSYANGKVGTADISKIHLQWYSDAECNNPIDVKDMAIKPDSDTYYYLKVTYDAGAPSEESNANTVLDGTTYVAGGSNHIQEATNPNNNNNPYGIYKIHVISGQIDIIKKVKETFSEDRIFQFNVIEKTENGDRVVEGSPFTVTVPANADTGTVSEADKAKLKNLSRGTYVVSEIVPGGYKITETDINGTDCESSLKDNEATFILGNGISTKQNVISAEYTYNPADGGVKGMVSYTNEYSVELDLKKVDSKGDNELSGAEFELKIKDDSTGTWKSAGEEYDLFEVKNDAVELKNLKPGLYKLKEIKAPRGYSVLGEEIYFQVRTGIITLTDENGTAIANKEMWTLENKILTIRNAKIYTLPNSGGPGIYGFTISGVAILATALLLFINNKRREEEAKRS